MRAAVLSLASSIFDLLHRLAHLVLWPKMVQTVIKVRLDRKVLQAPQACPAHLGRRVMTDPMAIWVRQGLLDPPAPQEQWGLVLQVHKGRLALLYSFLRMTAQMAIWAHLALLVRSAQPAIPDRPAQRAVSVPLALHCSSRLMMVRTAILVLQVLLDRSALRVRLDRKALKGRPAVEVVPQDRG